MTYKIRTVFAAVAVLTLPNLALAAKFSWFDEAPVRDSLGQLRMPLSPRGTDARLSFGIDAYNSFAASRPLEEYYDAAGSFRLSDGATVRLYGELAPRNDFYAPLPVLNATTGETGFPSSDDNRLSGFGVKWQHHTDSAGTIAFSAGYSEIPWSAATPHVDALDTRASLSWSGKWSGALQPGLTGSVFFGDENVQEEAYQQLGRRYYGFSVGGELRVAQDHTPYLSYRLRRSFHSPHDPAYLVAPYEDQAQISAGWRWQVMPNWSLQAEAHYGLNGANVDPYSPDRSRLFFGTRFDFR